VLDRWRQRSGFAARFSILELSEPTHFKRSGLSIPQEYNSPALSYIEGGRMHILAGVFVVVAVYCLWVVNRDKALIRASTEKARIARLASISRWHGRAAALSMLGLLIAVASLIFD